MYRKNTKGQYNLKDKKAQIYKVIEQGCDEYGNWLDGKLVPRRSYELWCYTRQLTQDQIYSAHAFMNNETRLFVFNYHKGIKPQQLIQYKGDWYEITRVDTSDDYNGDMFVYANNYMGIVKPYMIDIYKASEWGDE